MIREYAENKSLGISYDRSLTSKSRFIILINIPLNIDEFLPFVTRFGILRIIRWGKQASVNNGIEQLYTE